MRHANGARGYHTGRGERQQVGMTLRCRLLPRTAGARAEMRPLHGASWFGAFHLIPAGTIDGWCVPAACSPVAIRRAINHVCLGRRARMLHAAVAARGKPSGEVKMSEVNLERALNDPADLFES